MSYQARYDAEYEVRREARRKAFKRKRRRQRQIFALCFLCFILAFSVLVIYGAYRGIKFLHDRHIERITYVESADDGNTITLVYNVYSKEDNNSSFYEIDRKDDNNEEEYNPYEGIEPGSRGLIIVDAGHGGYDGGAEDNGVVEKDVNLSISLHLRDELVRRGYSVYLTRPDDEFVGLQQRASIANSLDNPKCLISIHQNSVDDYEAVCGMEAWTYDRSGCTELGNIICEEASKLTGAANRGTNYRTNLVVTSKTTMPAIIFECGYLSNVNEANLLSSLDYQKLIAKGVANGVDRFVDSSN